MEGQNIANRIAASIALQEHTFTTGSVGYMGRGKVLGDDGARYQVQVIATKIGSKPKTA